MSRVDEKYRPAIAGKKLPIVTIDHKWHQLFARVDKTRAVTEKEQQLNELLRRQGKCNSEVKSVRKIKKKLMDEIVTLMDRNDAAANAKIEENKRLINECNDKIKSHQEELLELPKQIEEVNAELMIETMKICYENMRLNEHHINSIGKWIADVRVELKKNVVRKQEMEIANQEIYSFMHDIFGADVIDIFDMKFKPEEHQVVRKRSEQSGPAEAESES